ncbi:uncharacterized protein LOC107270402 [Cephus cinctus]|uniref:Uncharacterized protein LOC107270402 n=1 Tax=Cephus cinctus TaxID=211228 RepID=A0AAJ7RM90_CEPCN|nr:uncharacterized protein LOC107270402 [Cephus cinctus]
MALSDFCREKGIKLVSLYPNASHILQPIDVAFFHSLKGIWGNVVRNWRLENNDQRLRREDFAPLLQKAIDTLDTKSILKSGFRTTGLYPFSADRIDYQNIFTNYDSSEKIPPVTETEGSRYKELLEYVENNIETEVLEMFRDVKEGAEWSGDLAHQSLFYLWRKIKDISINASEVSPAISADSVVQEGHVDDKNGVSIYSEYATGKVKQEKGNHENLNVINMAEFLPVGDNVLNIRDEISHNLSAVDADCKTIDTTLYEIDAPGTLVSFENINENPQEGTKQIKLEHQSTDEGPTELIELRSQCIDEKPKKPTSPNPSTPNSFPKRRSFRKINQAKRKVPAILTSDE